MKNKTNTKPRVTYALAVYDNKEIDAVVKSLKKNKPMLSIGENTFEFEKGVAKEMGMSFGVMVNSGSSANLLAMEMLNLPAGSEVITPIVTFSTTLAPIVQKGLIPVFVDSGIGNYQIDVSKIESAISKNTKALMIPMLIGNIPDLEEIQRIAKRHKLKVILDSCDTIGASFNGKPIGYYADFVTTSFYGSHVITAACGGGMICVHNKEEERELKLLRSWGRSSAVSNTDDIDERYKSTVNGIPYDEKFIFLKCGYNFLPLEISAAFGLVQLSRLDEFSLARKTNFKELQGFFKNFEKYFYPPEQDSRVTTNWLAFPLVVKSDAPFSRMEIVKYLEHENIQTRPLFSGNIIRHPAFKDIKARFASENFPNAEKIMRGSFLIACHHGLTSIQKKHLKQTFSNFLSKFIINSINEPATGKNPLNG